MTCGSKSLNSAEKQLYDNRSDDVIPLRNVLKRKKFKIYNVEENNLDQMMSFSKAKLVLGAN